MSSFSIALQFQWAVCLTLFYFLFFFFQYIFWKQIFLRFYERVEVTDIGNMVIRLFHSLSCDMFIASSKASSPHSRSSASSFSLQYLRFSLRSSSSCIHLLCRLPVLSTFPPTRVLEGSSYERCDQSSSTSFFSSYVGYSSPHWLYVTLHHFSPDRSNCAAALQIGRSLVRFQMVSVKFFFDIILPIALWPWGRLSL